MRTKSNCFVVDVRPEDCNTTFGMTAGLKGQLRFIPQTSKDGNRRKKVVLMADQGFVERANVAIATRCTCTCTCTFTCTCTCTCTCR